MKEPEQLAPVAVFAYNRPYHVRQAVESLLRNPLAARTQLHVFSDGPATGEAAPAVQQVRAYARTISGFASVTIHEATRNAGLAASIIDGVTSLCETFGQAIVVEDDLVVAPGFLDYMNRALDHYRDEERVMQISGYMFPAAPDTRSDALFLPFTTSWGWATWARAWRCFDPDMKGFDRLSTDKRLRDRFNLGGAYDYFGMLRQQRRGEVDSWAIRWYLSVFMKNGLVLYPRKTLVHNSGFDGSGTHGRGGAVRQQALEAEFSVESFPEHVSPHENLQSVLVGMPAGGTFMRRLLARTRSIVKRVRLPGSFT